MRLITTFAILTFYFTSLAQTNEPVKKIYDSTSLSLNGQAVDLYIKSNEIPDSMRKAIDLLDKAIEIDSTNYIFYANKANFLCDAGKYAEAINTLDKILMINPTLAEVTTFLGFILEKTGNNTRAYEIYTKAFSIYEKKLKASPDSINLLINRAFLYFFVAGTEQALKEYKEISKRFPGNYHVESIRETFESFNRKEFIDSIFKVD